MKLTILMYHKVDELPSDVRTPGNFVAPELFAAQLDALRALGYRTIDFADWLAHRDGGRPLPKRPLILTFDDGYTCFDERAWPALRSRDMGAWVFLVASQIGGTNAWDRGEHSFPLLGPERIAALRRDGVRFGSHGDLHVPLARVPLEQAAADLRRSRETLSELLGHSVDVVAYPFSNQSRAIRHAARAAGYRCAVRGKGRMNSGLTDRFGLRRIKMDSTMTVERLERILFVERYFRFL
ncbi:MAG TPA: polysaccharide deacetylase family protein [Gemmatimonadaceae bacterium]|jgi:peptidoglycan/xylan/chitin deacetylase (PgdA/CDA1 family)|nr:polysaccharide deacetylase family protein [Gemmatimonadaceae bacterium]